MSPQFNNMNDLTSYLEAMENRVKTLEGQNEFLKQSIVASVGEASRALPKTKLLSWSFFQRAFAVWGHNFMAQLIISLGLILIFLIIGLLIVLFFPALRSYLVSIFQGSLPLLY